MAKHGSGLHKSIYCSKCGHKHKEQSKIGKKHIGGM